MCYTGGPRCSGHVGNELSAATSNLATLIREKGEDSPAAFEAFSKREKLQMEFNSTPEGQRLLAAEAEALRAEGKESEADTVELTRMMAADLRDHDMSEREKRLAAGGKLSRACERPEEKSQGASAEARKIAAMDRKAAEARGETFETAAETKARKASDSQLMNVTPSDASYSNYDANLIPQANKVEKIASVLESIKEGANTSGSIGASLGMDNRQGHYYANGASYLGMVEKVESSYEGGGHEYRLTANGEILANEPDPQARAAMMRDVINAAPLMKVYHANHRDVDSVKEEISKIDPELSDDTIDRRAAAVVAWDKTVNSKGFDARLNTELQESNSRAKLAAVELKEERRLKKLAAAEADKPRAGFCPTCFMQRAANGSCDNCD